MKKKVVILHLVICLCVALLCACGVKTPEETTPPVVTFSQYTNIALFRDIPAVDMERFKIHDADEYGDGWFVMALKATQLPTLADYTDYVAVLEQNGFVKHSDSGETGIGNGGMLAATLQREGKVVSLTFAKYSRMFYISVAENKPVSPHLLYDESYVADNIPGAKTTLTMNQTCEVGNSFVIQLKNGHYIINDGGFQDDMSLLIQSLKDNAPEGQKPVVEAWFFSHDHVDHVGIMFDSLKIADEIIVEGFYCNQVSYDVANIVGMSGHKSIGVVARFAVNFKNSKGEQSPCYRMHAGERYYFNDITVEVPYTCEQVTKLEYSDDLNCSSTWLMYYIDGQKVLLNGDAELHNMQVAAEYFDQSYFDVDILSAPHHGYNLYTDDLDYFKCEVLLYSNWYHYSEWWSESIKSGNLTMQAECCDEYMCYVDGGKKLTFPYTIGTAETLETWYPDMTALCSERLDLWLSNLGDQWPATSNYNYK